MSPFFPRTTTLRGRVLANASVDDAFWLFSPEGEKLWVPSWDPEFLHPAGAEWQQGQIFRTREETGEAVWVITRLDRAAHVVEYHRVEPGRYVARIVVECRSVPEQATEATISYSFVGLSEDGNREIAAMTQEDYDAKMSRWTEWIRPYLTTHGGRSDG